MKKRNFYRILCLLYGELETAEQDEALAGDDLFNIAFSNWDDNSVEFFIAKLKHRLAEKKVKELKKQIKIYELKSL